MIVGLAHGGIGAFFLRRDGDQSMFGLLATGTGVAALTMAAPVQFEASIVPVAWVAEAAALAWVAVRQDHRYSAATSALLYALAGCAVLWVYAFDIDPLGMTLGSFVAGVGCGVWIVRGSRYASSLAALGLLVTAICVPVHLDGLQLVGAWSALMVVGFGVSRWLAEQRDGASIPALLRAVGRVWTADQSLPLSALLVGGLAVAHVLIVELPLRDFGNILPPEIPFTVAGAVAALVLAAAFLLSGVIAGGRDALRVAVLAAGAVVTYAIPFEVYAWAVSILWAGMAVTAIGMARVASIGHPAFRASSLVLIGGAALVAAAIVAPPSRLVVGETAIDANTILQSLTALAAVIGAAVPFASTEPDRGIGRWMWVLVGVAFVYAVSVVVVDLVGQTMRAGVDLEEVQTRGQVALSLLWAFLGIVAFVLGLRTRRALLRQTGLVLLAVATIKVFAFDLAALDVAYRVISLVVLGLVLLASAWLWQRSQPKPPMHGESP